MADPIIAAAPQGFAFGPLELKGRLLSWSGGRSRRGVSHVFLKRTGGRVEDMARDQRRLEVRLVFLGESCARDYANFERAVDENPYGLLVHPTAGRWQAFCEGPQESVDFSRASDGIEVRVSFVENELDAAADLEVPDVATAAQNTSAQQTAFQKTVARYLGTFAKLSDARRTVVAAVNGAVAVIDTVTAPVDFMRDTISAVVGVQSNIYGKISAIATKSNLLAQDVTNYIDATGDIFDGTEDADAGAARAATTLLGVVEVSAEQLVDEMIAGAASAASAADAVGAVDEALSACHVLNEAIERARPPVILYVVPELIDLVLLCRRRYGATDALARANDIRQLNKIPNPAAIPPGTALLIPSR